MLEGPLTADRKVLTLLGKAYSSQEWESMKFGVSASVLCAILTGLTLSQLQIKRVWAAQDDQRGIRLTQGQQVQQDCDGK